MEIIINDANILIDCINCGITELFSKCGYRLITSDLVFNEISTCSQKDAIIELAKRKILEIEEITTLDLLSIIELKEQTKGLTIEDCSVWFLAKKKRCILLTGDAKLRKSAGNDTVKVKGIFFVFDEIIQKKVLSIKEAKHTLKILMDTNSRLPKEEFEKRLFTSFWE